MSEYQFYEFQSVDKLLTEREKEEISTWSNRTAPSNTGAVFTYSYSDFPKDELRVIEQYFDAMFYTSNWGYSKLVFKFPTSEVDVGRLKQYCQDDETELIEKKDVCMLVIRTEDEDDSMWIEGDGILSGLLALRHDILAGDYRCLYLMWLKENTVAALSEYSGDILEDFEPQVPDNLHSLSGALRRFVKLFDIDQVAIAVAAQQSQEDASQEVDFEKQLSKLSQEVKDDFLRRVVNSEPLLDIKLKNVLKEFAVEKRGITKSKLRTLGQITVLIKKKKDESKEVKEQEETEKRLVKVKRIAQLAPSLWPEIEPLIEKKRTDCYDEVVKILVELKEVAIYKKDFRDYCNKVEAIKSKYKRLSSLKARIEDAKLLEE